MVFITVFYHRGLAHQSVTLSPGLRRLVIATGVWVTGLDPKGWACMHRLHHAHSDTPLDPHSPVNVGIFGVFSAQLRSYKRVLRKLIQGNRELEGVVRDLDFPVSRLNRRGLWLAPYLAHLGVAAALALALRSPLAGLAYFAGLMSHPVQGWLVNSFGHAKGYRTFPLADDSRNNTLVGLFVMGEGYQNNHHRYPRSAKFSLLWREVDLGYVFCRLFDAVGLLEIRRETLIPPQAAEQSDESDSIARHAA
jgi:stearoyl-CoA desaturase (delta-9 desaturase)